MTDSNKDRAKGLMLLLQDQTNEEKCLRAIQLHDEIVVKEARLDELKEIRLRADWTNICASNPLALLDSRIATLESEGNAGQEKTSEVGVEAAHVSAPPSPSAPKSEKFDGNNVSITLSCLHDKGWSRNEIFDMVLYSKKEFFEKHQLSTAQLVQACEQMAKDKPLMNEAVEGTEWFSLKDTKYVFKKAAKLLRERK